MATLSEHAAAIRAAVESARSDGCLLDWGFGYGELYDVQFVELALYRTRRDSKGIVRVEERKEVLEVDV